MTGVCFVIVSVVTRACFVIVSVCDWGYALSLSQFVTGGTLCHCLSL